MIHILSLYFAIVHAFHISKTEVNLDDKSNAIQITSHIFIDDLERQLGTQGHKNLRIGTKKEMPNVDSILQLYFDEHLVIDINGRSQKLDYLGKELSSDLQAIWCYLEIPLGDSTADMITVKNTVLIEVYDDQKNIIMVKHNNNLKEHLILDTKSVKTPNIKY